MCCLGGQRRKHFGADRQAERGSGHSWDSGADACAKAIDERKVILAIDPKKDVDCFHPVNVGNLHTGGEGFLPCTPAGIIELIKRSGHSIEGKQCVVIGRSNIVGKPVAMLLMQENGTVTICHSRTRNLAEICRGADIIVSAVGKVNTVTAGYGKGRRDSH